MKNFFTFPLICVLIMLGINAQTTAFAIVGPPTTQAGNIIITNLTATSATISWTNGSGANRVVTLENPSGTAAAPTNGITYTASTDWSVKGTQLGSSNYYCIYNGSGNTVTVTNLIPNSKFTVRISEYNGSAGGEQYLTDVSSVTDNPFVFYTPVATPTIQSGNILITNLTATSATISWTSGNGANRVVFVENPSGIAKAPYNNTTYTASTDWNVKGTRIGTSNYYCVYNGSGNSVTLTNLAPNSKYSVRVSEYNGSVGEEQYFTDISAVNDNPLVFYTYEVTPSIQAKNVVITNLTATSATISWTNGDGSNRVAFVENPSGTARAPYNITTYTASTDWNAKGTQLPNSNYYCIYNGIGNSVTLTNLTPDSKYSVRISEYNGSAGSEQYFTQTANDNPFTFYTLVSTDIKTSDAIVSVSVSPNPTTGVITVKSNKNGEGMNITISNIHGNEVHRATTSQNSLDIDLTGEAAGIYIVKVDINGVITYCKVIKK